MIQKNMIQKNTWYKKKPHTQKKRSLGSHVRIWGSGGSDVCRKAVAFLVHGFLPETQSYIVPVKAIQTPSGYGRPVIQPIVSRCTITRDLEKYYKGWKSYIMLL